MKSFTIVSVNTSDRKGIPKKPVEKIFLKNNFGVEGDAHAGNWHRQVSLLAAEDIDYMNGKGAGVTFGDFAENITTRGIVLHELPVGSTLAIGSARLEVTQIGKECHKGCAIMQKVGDCIMPKRGIFAKVIEEGEVTNESIGHYGL
jgi:MOSC domain-containing protein YiiM